MNETDDECGSVAPSPFPNHLQPTHNFPTHYISPTTPNNIIIDVITTYHFHFTTTSNDISINVTYNHITITYDNVIYITDYQVLTYDYTIDTASNYCYVYIDYQALMYLVIFVLFIMILVLMLLVYMMRLSLKYFMSN